MADDQNVTTQAGQVNVSRQLLNDHLRIDIEAMILDHLLHPPTAEQIAAAKVEREAIWDEKTAAGLIGIYDHSDYECGPDWTRVVDRGDPWVERWVTAEAWARYEAAAEALDEAEQALEAS